MLWQWIVFVALPEEGNQVLHSVSYTRGQRSFKPNSPEFHSQFRDWVCHSRNSGWGRKSSHSCRWSSHVLAWAALPYAIHHLSHVECSALFYSTTALHLLTVENFRLSSSPFSGQHTGSAPFIGLYSVTLPRATALCAVVYATCVTEFPLCLLKCVMIAHARLSTTAFWQVSLFLKKCDVQLLVRFSL